jgi:hypothetical protein
MKTKKAADSDSIIDELFGLFMQNDQISTGLKNIESMFDIKVKQTFILFSRRISLIAVR